MMAAVSFVSDSVAVSYRILPEVAATETRADLRVDGFRVSRSGVRLRVEVARRSVDVRISLSLAGEDGPARE
jgi:hypothetical protein